MEICSARRATNTAQIVTFSNLHFIRVWFLSAKRKWRTLILWLIHITTGLNLIVQYGLSWRGNLKYDLCLRHFLTWIFIFKAAIINIFDSSHWSNDYMYGTGVTCRDIIENDDAFRSAQLYRAFLASFRSLFYALFKFLVQSHSWSRSSKSPLYTHPSSTKRQTDGLWRI